MLSLGVIGYKQLNGEVGCYRKHDEQRKEKVKSLQKTSISPPLYLLKKNIFDFIDKGEYLDKLKR